MGRDPEIERMTLFARGIPLAGATVILLVLFLMWFGGFGGPWEDIGLLVLLVACLLTTVSIIVGAVLNARRARSQGRPRQLSTDQ